MKECCQKILIITLILLIGACSSATPPRELAPGGDIVKRAIELQIDRSEQRISEYLTASPPKLEINKIAVKQIEPIFVGDLAAYHLQGTYNLTLKFSRQQVTQNKNSFDIYLQRQAEGKTWRLLRRDFDRAKNSIQWSSYLIN